ncbi:MAG: endolytic transglycosylase MltG [Bacteroidaceae bacterium]|nr:endolytic transglycosylase MltG [Bacteroidaceae bacterium]
MKLKWIFITLGTIMVAGVILAAYAYYLVKSPIVKIDNTSYIYIYPNDSASTIIKNIQEAVHPANITGFKLLAYHNNLDKQKRTGKYAIYDGDNMHTLYRRIVSNQQTPVKVTVPATRTIEQMVGIVCNQLMIDSVQLNEFTVTPGFYNRIGYTEETLPTLFLPNTYEVYWNIEPERFIIRMMKEHRAFWNEERRDKAAAIGLTIEEVATLASIVDEETNNDAEKPIVAGLYVNRLKRGMLLQADPTVKYALGDFTRKRILKEDLETDSPYNTYKYKGLPPGPIRIPTLQAIESVLNHAKHNYIYMCAKEDFSGTHNFATTLAEHNANARRYQQALNRLKINK